MRLLDRYLLRELLIPLGFCLAGFLIFWSGFDVLAELNEYQKEQLRIGEVLMLYWLRLPEMLVTVLPVGLLLAMLYALTQHARHQELTAIRAAGVGWWRLCMPYFATGIAFSSLLYVLNEIWFPNAPDQVADIRQSHATTPTERVWRTRINFRNQASGRHWNIGAFNHEDGHLIAPSFRDFLGADAYRLLSSPMIRWTNGGWFGEQTLESLYRSVDDFEPAVTPRPWLTLPAPLDAPSDLARLAQGTLTESNRVLATNVISKGMGGTTHWTIDALDPAAGWGTNLTLRLPLGAGAQRLVQAESAEWHGKKWHFSGVREYIYRSSVDEPVLVIRTAGDFPELTETPDQIRSELKIGGRNLTKAMKRPTLSVADVRNYRRLHPHLGPAEAAFLGTQLQARLAGPWTCLVVVLIAIPFGASPERRNLFYGVAGSISLAFAYFVVQRLGFALGQKGVLEPWLAAWLPNLLFALIGVTLILRLK